MGQKKLLFVAIFFLSFLTIGVRPIRAASLGVAGSSAQPKNRLDEEKEDPRVIKLKSFLLEKNSILAEYADCFIASADKHGLGEYDLDFLVPAITGLESSFGKRYPRGTHNAYGWASGAYSWDSWEESIDHVTRVLRQKYIDRGADTVSKIGPIYAESPTWAQRVALIKKQIESFNPQPSLTI